MMVSSAHRDVATPSQVSGDARAPARASFNSNDPHDLPVKFELNFRVRQQTGLFPDARRMVTCSLDVMRIILTPTCKSKTFIAERTSETQQRRRRGRISSRD